jgi:hypothetical protein
LLNRRRGPSFADMRIWTVLASMSVGALALGALALGACSSSVDRKECQRCDGNVAVNCDHATCTNDFSNPVREDCGEKKCFVTTSTTECEHTNTKAQESIAFCD